MTAPRTWSRIALLKQDATVLYQGLLPSRPVMCPATGNRQEKQGPQQRFRMG